MRTIKKILLMSLPVIFMISVRASMPSNSLPVPVNAAMQKAHNEYKKNLHEYKEMLQEINDKIKGRNEVKDSYVQTVLHRVYHQIRHGKIVNDQEVIAMVENFLNALQKQGKEDPLTQDLTLLNTLLQQQIEKVNDIIKKRMANEEELRDYMAGEVRYNELKQKEKELLIEQDVGNKDKFQQALEQIKEKSEIANYAIFHARDNMNINSYYLVIIKAHLKALKESVDELLHLQNRSQNMAMPYQGSPYTFPSRPSQLVDEDQSRAEGEQEPKVADDEDEMQPGLRRRKGEFDKIY